MEADRSRLLNKQKDEERGLEKKIKKLKGALKDAATKELVDLQAKHAEELREFDGAGKAVSSVKEEKPKEPAKTESIKNFKERNWNGMSKKELESACVERGLGKKGGKEDLVVKLISFHQELATKIAANPDLVEKEPEPVAESESESEEESESESEDDDSEEEPPLPADPEEAEKQFKREKIVRKAFQSVFKNVDEFQLDEIPEKLKLVNVKGFTPQMCGYVSLRGFAKSQPRSVFRFSRKTGLIRAPKSK